MIYKSISRDRLNEEETNPTPHSMSFFLFLPLPYNYPNDCVHKRKQMVAPKKCSHRISRSKRNSTIVSFNTSNRKDKKKGRNRLLLMLFLSTVFAYYIDMLCLSCLICNISSLKVHSQSMHEYESIKSSRNRRKKKKG